MYLGQFLDYIHPIYHFRILKVPSLSTHKDESIIFVFCTTLYVIEIIEEKHVLLAQDFYDSTYSPTYYKEPTYYKWFIERILLVSRQHSNQCSEHFSTLCFFIHYSKHVPEYPERLYPYTYMLNKSNFYVTKQNLPCKIFKWLLRIKNITV